MDWGAIITNAISLIVGGIVGGLLENSRGWIKHRKELYDRWRKLLSCLINEINEIEEKVKSFDKSPYVIGEFSEILPHRSRLNFSDLLEAIRYYNAIYKATVETILKITNEEFKDLNSVPTEGRIKIFEIIGYSTDQDFINSLSRWFVDNFCRDILRQILDDKPLDLDWFVKKTSSLNMESKIRIKRVLDQSDILFEAILNRLERSIEREHIIRVLEKQRKKVLQKCEQLKESVHRDLRYQKILYPIKKVVDEQTIEKLEEILEWKRKASLYL